MVAAPLARMLQRAGALLGGAVLVAWCVAILEGIGLWMAGRPRAVDDWGHALLLYGWFAVATTALVALTTAPFERRRPGRIEALLLPVLGCGLAVLVGGTWWNRSPSLPPSTSAAGIAINAALGLIGLAALVLIVRGRSRRPGPPGIRRRPWAIAPTLLLLLATLLALRSPPDWARSRPSPATDHPPVIMIVVDTLRRDHLGCYGYDRDTSPNLDALAADGLVFDRATTSGNFTVPSIATLLTGLYPSTHGVIGFHDRIDPGLETLPERFRRAGYRTAAFVANPILRPASGFARGFGRFDPPPPPGWVKGRTTALELVAARLRERLEPGRAADLVPRAVDWILAPSDRPPFAWVHLLEPHSPYAPPPDLARLFDAGADSVQAMDPPNLWDYRSTDRWENFEDFEDFPGVDPGTRETMVALYDAEVRHADAWVGRFIAELRAAGLYDPALILLLSDHGEEFDDHGGWFHGLTLYEEMVGMPLVVKLPDQVGAGRRSARPVDMVDLAATISTLARLDHDFGGEDHGHALDGPAGPARAFVERPPHLYGLRRGDWKLIRRMRDGVAEDRLFNLAHDPGEQFDLAATHPDTLLALQVEMDATLSGIGTPRGTGANEGLDPAARRALRALGYTQ